MPEGPDRDAGTATDASTPADTTTRRPARVISDARPTEGEAILAADDVPADGRTATEPAGADGSAARDEAGTLGRSGKSAAGTRLALPVVPVLSVLLVVLLAGAGFLWFTRPGQSAVTAEDYGEALQAARSGIVDLTSFDHLTLDDDIEQIRRVATGDLREESVAQLNERRQEITGAEAVVSTEIVGAGVTAADPDGATVLMVIQTTRGTSASEQAQIVKYRVQVELQHEDGRWLLSGITGR